MFVSWVNIDNNKHSNQGFRTGPWNCACLRESRDRECFFILSRPRLRPCPLHLSESAVPAASRGVSALGNEWWLKANCPCEETSLRWSSSCQEADNWSWKRTTLDWSYSHEHVWIFPTLRRYLLLSAQYFFFFFFFPFKFKYTVWDLPLFAVVMAIDVLAQLCITGFCTSQSRKSVRRIKWIL